MCFVRQQNTTYGGISRRFILSASQCLLRAWTVSTQLNFRLRLISSRKIHIFIGLALRCEKPHSFGCHWNLNRYQGPPKPLEHNFDSHDVIVNYCEICLINTRHGSNSNFNSHFSRSLSLSLASLHIHIRHRIYAIDWIPENLYTRKMANDRLDVVIFGASGFSEYTNDECLKKKTRHLRVAQWHSAIDGTAQWQ